MRCRLALSFINNTSNLTRNIRIIIAIIIVNRHFSVPSGASLTRATTTIIKNVRLKPPKAARIPSGDPMLLRQRDSALVPPRRTKPYVFNTNDVQSHLCLSLVWTDAVCLRKTYNVIHSRPLGRLKLGHEGQAGEWGICKLHCSV